MKITKGLNSIDTLEEWFQHAPPQKHEFQWVDGRSAKEVARAWLTEAPRDALRQLLEPKLGPVTLSEAEPECEVRFDQFSGPRQCDLVVLGKSLSGNLIIHVEGKADESFDRLVGDVYDKATKENAARSIRRLSKVPARVEQLAQRLFARDIDERVRALRYQLLFATAAVLADAARRHASTAVMLVHVLHSAALDARKLSSNQADWTTFLQMFQNGSPQEDACGDRLHGPFNCSYEAWSGVDLFLGKMTSLLAAT